MKNLYQALFQAQAALTTISKDSEGVFGPYSSLEVILETIKPVLKDHGLLIIHKMESQFQDIDQKNHHIILNTELIHVESGQSIQSKYLLVPEKYSPQGYGGAITYARRYCILALLGLASGDDPDAAQGVTAPPTKTPKPRAPQKELGPPPTGDALRNKKIATGQRFRDKRYGDVPIEELAGFATWLRENVRNLNRYQLEFLSDVDQLRLESEGEQGDLNQGFDQTHDVPF